MKRNSLMKKLAALMITLTLLLGSFPFIYAEEGQTPEEIAAAEEADRIAAEQEAAEEAARIAAEEEQRQAEEEAARRAE